MNQVQIEIVELQLLQRLGKRQLGTLVVGILNPELGRDEQLLTRYAAALDRASDRFLV
ncbi:hypothetical protein D3C81_2199360 [compost metagenome]